MEFYWKGFANLRVSVAAVLMGGFAMGAIALRNKGPQGGALGLAALAPSSRLRALQQWRRELMGPMGFRHLFLRLVVWK